VRIVLDECLNPRVRHLLETEHTLVTVLELGWGGLPDHTLLRRLHGRCEVFLTIDRGFEHQHDLLTLPFGIVIVHVPKNRFAHYEVIREWIRDAVASAKPGQVVHVPPSGA
jgi:hypothetical protein